MALAIAIPKSKYDISAMSISQEHYDAISIGTAAARAMPHNSNSNTIAVPIALE